MLRLEVPMAESFDSAKNEFVASTVFVLELEHSLASLSKWEAKFEKAFLGKQEKSVEEVIEYIRIMVQTPDVPEEVFGHFSPENMSAINDYINAKMTATTINEVPGRSSQEVITAELIYYWMIALNVPFECQHWHLNKLIMLIRVCNVKNKPPRKMSKGEAMRRQRETNAMRRASLGTRG